MSSLKYRMHLNLLNIKNSEWENLTLPAVIKAFNSSRAIIGKMEGKERETMESKVNNAYEIIREAVLKGKNKKGQKDEKESEEEEIVETKEYEIDFESLLPKLNNVIFNSRSEASEKLVLPEDMVGEAAFLPIELVTKFKIDLEHLHLPSQKDYSEILIYSDQEKMLRIQLVKTAGSGINGK